MTLSKRRRIERIITRIENQQSNGESISEDFHRFNWLGRCTEKRVLSAERNLDLQFPASYRDLLLLKGGGGLEDFYIWGIPPKGPLDGPGSYLNMVDRYREDWVTVPLPPHLIPIEENPDDLKPYCLDTTTMRRNECHVVLYNTIDGETFDVAPNFVSFWEEWVSAYLDPRR